MSDLKPCPFCGEVPTIKNKSENLALFLCRGEACYGSGMWTCFLREDQDKAIAAWNTRADLVDPAAIREAALREAATVAECDGCDYTAALILTLIGEKGTKA